MRYLMFLVIFAGCHGPKSADAAPPKNETIVAALERYNALAIERQKSTEAKVDTLAETVGNATAELEAVKEELRALQKLLTVADEIAVPVPKVDAPPPEQAGQRITFKGKPIDVDSWLRRSVTTVEIVGDVDKHLREHGLAGDFSGLSRSQKIKLHSVAHSGVVSVQAPRKVVVNAPVMLPQSSNCANGNCVNPQYGYQSQRRGLFGRWR